MAIRTTISYDKSIADRAKAIKRIRGIGGRGLGKLIDILIREEYERRHAPVIAHDMLKSLGEDEGGSHAGEGGKPKPPKY